MATSKIKMSDISVLKSMGVAGIGCFTEKNVTALPHYFLMFNKTQHMYSFIVNSGVQNPLVAYYSFRISKHNDGTYVVDYVVRTTSDGVKEFYTNYTFTYELF